MPELTCRRSPFSPFMAKQVSCGQVALVLRPDASFAMLPREHSSADSHRLPAEDWTACSTSPVGLWNRDVSHNPIVTWTRSTDYAMIKEAEIELIDCLSVENSRYG